MSEERELLQMLWGSYFREFVPETIRGFFQSLAYGRPDLAATCAKLLWKRTRATVGTTAAVVRIVCVFYFATIKLRLTRRATNEDQGPDEPSAVDSRG